MLTVIAVILLLSLLLTAFIRFNIIYDEGLYVTLTVAGIRFRLYPEKPPAQSLSYKKLNRQRKRLTKTTKKQPTDKKVKIKKEKTKKTFTDSLELVREIFNLISTTMDKLFGYLRFKVKHFDLVVATGDAAKTALIYTAVCQSLNVLIDLLENSDRCSCQFNDMDCRCDFLADKFSCTVDIELKVRIWQAIHVLLCLLMKLIKKNILIGGKDHGK